jgi:hypothetical protein
MITLLVVAIVAVIIYKAKFAIVEKAIAYVKNLICNGHDFKN